MSSNLLFESDLPQGHDDDGSISGMEIAENRMHREAGDCRPGAYDDDEDEDSLTARDKAKARHAENGAQERKLLLGLARQEPGSAQVRRGKSVEGLKWEHGHLRDRPWTEHPTFRESVRRQNAFQRAEDQFHAPRARSFDDAGYAPPDATDPDYRQVKTVERVAATSKRRRLSKAEMAVKGTLLKLTTGIRAATERGERAKAGAMLNEAKGILGHGQFLDWLEREIGLSARTAQRYQEAAER
jgi:hypothetical protein